MPIADDCGLLGSGGSDGGGVEGSCGGDVVNEDVAATHSYATLSLCREKLRRGVHVQIATSPA